MEKWEEDILRDTTYPCTTCENYVICSESPRGTKCKEWRKWFSKSWNETRKIFFELEKRRTKK